jgi:hypothetical protein
MLWLFHLEKAAFWLVVVMVRTGTQHDDAINLLNHYSSAKMKIYYLTQI